jgi:hypothetical protein
VLLPCKQRNDRRRIRNEVAKLLPIIFMSVEKLQVLQKPKIIFPLSSNLSYPANIDSCRLRIKRKIKQDLDKELHFIFESQGHKHQVQ